MNMDVKIHNKILSNRIQQYILYDPAIPLLGIYPEKTIIQKDIYTSMFIAALFTVTRTWKQPRCPSTDEWLKKLWYIDTYILFSHKNEYIWVSPNEVDEPRTYYTEEVRQKEKEKYHILMHIYGI